jgi:tRNA pseudouridine13 synthase
MRQENISYRHGSGKTLKAVPRIDQLAGIGCYCTDSTGIGGAIKQQSDEFRVSELVDESQLDVSHSYGEEYRYPLYILEKKGVDSNHALFEIERAHRIRLRVMGIKDAKATTRQYAGAQRAWKDPSRELSTPRTRITLHGFTRRPIGRESLAGNEFVITIRGCRGDAGDFAPQIPRIANFYGLQRFGSERLVTHLAGRAVVKRDFGLAVRLLLSYTTEYDTDASREIRIKCEDPANYRKALLEMPRGMDIEAALVLTHFRQGRGGRAQVNPDNHPPALCPGVPVVHL